MIIVLSKIDNKGNVFSYITDLNKTEIGAAVVDEAGRPEMSIKINYV